MKTIPETIRDLFDIESVSESALLKDKANSFRRNGLLKVVEEQRVQRSAVYLQKGQDIVLFNALLLNAVFTDPKYVKKIFDDKATRQDATKVIRSMLLERSSVCGIALASVEVAALVSSLESEEVDLYSEKLPNPFEVLPQVVLGQHTNLLNVLLAQASALDPIDSVLAAYVSGDVKKALHLSDKIANPAVVKPLIDMIYKQDQEIKRFMQLLDDFL